MTDLAAVAGRHQHGSDSDQIGFCSYCGRIGDDLPRVCGDCGLGVRLRTDRRALRSPSPFLIVRGDGVVSAASAAAERELPHHGPLVGAPLLSVLAPREGDLAGTVALAASGNGGVARIPVAPVATTRRFQGALQATIASCGEPRAALVVLERTP